MVALLPLILLSGVGYNTEFDRSYTYSANCEIYFDTLAYFDEEEEVNLSFWFEGHMVFNNDYNFRFICEYGGLNISSLYYDNEISYSIDANLFSFDEGGINMYIAVNYDWQDSENNGISVAYSLGSSFVDYAFPSMTYYAEEMGLSFTNSFNYKADMSNNSALIDYVNKTFSNALLVFNNDANFAYNNGYNKGLSDGVDKGYSQGYINGKSDGYDLGYNVGFNDGVSEDATAVTIFNGILSIAMIPVDFFLSIFNFEILGVNLTSFVTALLSVGCLIILLKKIFGGSSGGGDKK